jgi:hypothetical protein
LTFLEGDELMKWVTRERPVIDRIACPWLIARFIDKEPEFLFAPPDQVERVAEETGATPYDIPDVEFTHEGDGCSFDAFVSKYGLDRDPAILALATIIRGADTGRPDLTPQSARACWRSRWASGTSRRMTTRCCGMASSFTTRSMPGPRGARRSPITGRQP